MNIAVMAWRNLTRNRRRTVISGVAAGVATLITCLVFAIKGGMLDNMQSNIINHVAGNIRVQNMLYAQNERYMPLQFFVPNVEKAIEDIKKIPGVSDATPATNFPVFIYRENTNVAAQVYGIDFASSRIINDRETALMSGRLPNSGNREVLMSEGLAVKLKLSAGDKMTIFSKTATGGSNGITWIVTGIAHIGDADINIGSIFVDWQDSANFLRMIPENAPTGIASGAIQLLVFTDPGANQDVIIPQIQRYFYSLDFEADVRRWQDVSAMSELIQLMNLIYTFICVAFFILASTVIYNTAMMSVLERKKEIATLVSLGLEGKKITLLFFTESLLIAAFACIAGIALGFGFVSVLHTQGLDMNALGGGSTSGMSLSSFIYPWIRPGSYLLIFIMGVAISGLACIKPARMPLAVEPAEALRSEN